MFKIIAINHYLNIYLTASVIIDALFELYIKIWYFELR